MMVINPTGYSDLSSTEDHLPVLDSKPPRTRLWYIYRYHHTLELPAYLVVINLERYHHTNEQLLRLRTEE